MRNRTFGTRRVRGTAIVAALALGTLALGACNTVKGAGKDVQSAGQAGEDAIKGK